MAMSNKTSTERAGGLPKDYITINMTTQSGCVALTIGMDKRLTRFSVDNLNEFERLIKNKRIFVVRAHFFAKYRFQRVANAGFFCC